MTQWIWWVEKQLQNSSGFGWIMNHRQEVESTALEKVNITEWIITVTEQIIPMTQQIESMIERILNITKKITVSGDNATDKTPTDEMALIFVFWVSGLGRAFFVGGVLGVWRFVIGILSRDCIPQLYSYDKNHTYIARNNGLHRLDCTYMIENITHQRIYNGHICK